jgi:threonine synthase
MTLTLSTNQVQLKGWPGLIEAYRPYLPVSQATPVVTLQEGNTPLLPVPSIAQIIGKQVQVYVKYDGLNPTGSFKDRGMTKLFRSIPLQLVHAYEKLHPFFFICENIPFKINRI